MKKYFLDERYREFKRRVHIVLSILVGIIVFVGIGATDGFYDLTVVGALFVSALWAFGVWILYRVIHWVIRWILKALPDE